MTHRPKSEFLQRHGRARLLQDCTDLEGLDAALAAGVVPAYIGFDATATSLHVGSLIQIMMLRWLQKTGHRPMVLMGGGTSKVGDPSFRDDERPLLTPRRRSRANIAGIAPGLRASTSASATGAIATRACSTTPSGSTG